MQFFDIWTNYKRFGKELDYHKTPKLFYKDLINSCSKLNSKFNYFAKFQSNYVFPMEDIWYKCGMPYYNVWPGVIDTLIKTRLDIKAGLLRFSHLCFSIRLPKTEEPILSFDHQGEKAIIEEIMILGFYRTEEQVNLSIKVSYKSEKSNCPGTFINVVQLGVNKTIESGLCLKGFIDKDINNQDYVVPDCIVDACARLSIAVIFLSTGSHKILEYDVLAKHLEVYRKEQNKNKKRHYEHQAQSKGKHGWNVGSGRGDRGLKLPSGVSYEQACKEAGGRELLYQHVRGGHWHTVRYGEGRKDIKVVWFEETVVRKDLLPKPMNV